MAIETDIFAGAPEWLLRRLPINSSVDAELEAEIDKLSKQLPGSLFQIGRALDRVRSLTQYDSAANRASVHVWRQLGGIYSDPAWYARIRLLQFARDHMVEAARARVFRRLVKDSEPTVRRRARKILAKSVIREVALPAGDDGDWACAGWLYGTETDRLHHHTAGRRIQSRYGLPELETIADLRKLLGIRTKRHLGYLLLATDESKDSPYTNFTIPKRDGSERTICAPKSSLRWVQVQILRHILDKMPVHPAAHGFVKGRSTVTNAQPHVGAEVVVKFDLTDFFPTIHYFRVVGLFASLGYFIDDGRFGSQDSSRRVAATLGRLCSYTPAASEWGAGFVPQGAPTSPAISNLVCRGLDARLQGLAQRNEGVYTRYADDLTFSFRDRSTDLGRFRWWVDQICHQEGFFVNQKKFRVISRSQRQSVTGLVVNDELRVPRRERRRIRAIVHNCRKHGVDAQTGDNPALLSYLQGYASYIHMVHPDEGKRLLAQIAELTSR